MNSYCFCLRCRHWSSSVFTLATLPICHRCAIQATVTSVSFRNRTALFTFSRSPLLRLPSAASVHGRRCGTECVERTVS